jgi:hypothetical protein
MKSLKEWFKKTFPEEPLPRAERRHVDGLAALHWTGKCPGLDDVKDISSSGIYIKTNERWPPGEINPIRLTSDEIPEDDPDHDVEIQTRAVRWGDDGMGLSFILPENMELWLWRGNTLAEAAEIVHEFRVARAIAFLKRICPSVSHELDLLFREGLSNIRIRHTVEITLRAEEMLANEPRAHRMRAPKDIVLRITENGSWSDAELTQGFWAGLLALSCKAGENDESVTEFIDTLSEMATMHSQIFTAACTKATKVVGEDGSLSAVPMICKAEQLMEIAEAHDFLRIDRNLTQLSDLGLIEKREKSKYFTPTDDANVTPTSRGLEMYARCHGFHGPVHEFYGLTSASSPVAPGKE